MRIIIADKKLRASLRSNKAFWQGQGIAASLWSANLGAILNRIKQF